MKKVLFLLLLFVVQATTTKAQTHPNIIFVLIDDAPMRLIFGDSLSSGRAGIDSLRTRGATVTGYTASGLCTPSRASMHTGLYPASHGAVDNSSSIRSNLMFFQDALAGAGYNVNVVGKTYNTAVKKARDGVNKQISIKIIDFKDPFFFKKNGNKFQIFGHTTQIISDTALSWLSNIATLPEPFYIWTGKQSPHAPPTPTPKNKNLYENLNFPLPANFDRFTNDYPDFLYSIPGKYHNPEDTGKLKTTIRKSHETIADISDFIIEVRELLRSQGRLENTAIILMSDNGYQFGEHSIKGKNSPYEGSIRIPCIIEYHPLFEGGTTIPYTGFNSVDVGATILDLANVSDTNFDNQSIGISLFDLMENPRDTLPLLKYKIGSAEDDDSDTLSPSFRGLRTPDFKYVKYHCDSLTEELFDLVNDPEENTNEIRNPAYATVVAHFRARLPEVMAEINDTMSIDTVLRPCKLITTGSKLDLSETSGPRISVFPNPASEKITMIGINEGETIELYSILGVHLGTFRNDEFDVSSLPDGPYVLKLDGKNTMFIKQ